MKNYEIDVVVNKVVRLITEKKKLEWGERLKNDKRLDVLKKDVREYNKEYELLMKKEEKLKERVANLNLEVGNVQWYGGSASIFEWWEGVGDLENKVRENVVIWNMDGKKVEGMIDELVKMLG